MKSYEFLFWAYNIVWLVLAGYVFFTFQRLRKLDRRLDRLEQDRHDS